MIMVSPTALITKPLLKAELPTGHPGMAFGRETTFRLFVLDYFQRGDQALARVSPTRG